MASGMNTGLGRAGIGNAQGQQVAEFDVCRGWQSINPVIATTSTLTNMDNPPADAVQLPNEGRNIQLRMLGKQTAGTVACDIFLWPNDPGVRASATDLELDKTEGNAAGQYVETDTFTTTARTATSPSVAASTFYVSDEVIVDRRGMAFFAIRPTGATTVVPASSIEGAYRVF